MSSKHAPRNSVEKSPISSHNVSESKIKMTVLMDFRICRSGYSNFLILLALNCTER